MGLLWFEYQPPLSELHLRKENGAVKMVNLQAVYSRASLYINIKCSRTVAGYIHSDEGLTLETSASESLYGGQFTLSTQLIKPNYLAILPPTQHHSFCRNLPPFFNLE